MGDRASSPSSGSRNAERRSGLTTEAAIEVDAKALGIHRLRCWVCQRWTWTVHRSPEGSAWPICYSGGFCAEHCRHEGAGDPIDPKDLARLRKREAELEEAGIIEPGESHA
jgi:hypothetical protein